MPLGERAHQRAAGFAVTADQVERLSQVLDLLGKAPFRHGQLEGRVLHQRENVTDSVEPDHHRRVDSEDHPQTLAVGELVGNLAETDGSGGVADHVDGMQEIHAPWITVGILPGYQHQAEDGDGVGQHQGEQWPAHAPEDEKGNGVHDWRRRFSDAASPSL